MKTTTMKIAKGIVILFVSLFGLQAFAEAKGTTEQSVKALKKKYLRPKKVPYLDTNPYSKAKEELGRLLYFEPRLSKSGVMSCATCHSPSLGWGDGLAKSVGANHMVLDRRTPTILNLAWTEKLMWDGRFNHLEGQALGPITSAGEMGMAMEGHDGVLSRLTEVAEYRKLFEKAFPGKGISSDTVAKAIAIYERGVVSGEAPFDRWVAGNEKAISESAKKGFMIFNTKANCVACHSGWNFSDGSFHDIGLAGEDIGRGKFLKLKSQQHAFKTPGLRDISRRAPYMHDGSEKTLAEVIEFYNQGGKVKRDSLSGNIKPLNLTAAEKKQLEDFLVTLNGKEKPVVYPLLPVVSTKQEGKE